MKITEREVQELIDNIDNDDNTSINYTEFIASTIDLGKVLTEDKIELCSIALMWSIRAKSLQRA